MGKSSRKGQALLEILVFIQFCVGLVVAIYLYEQRVEKNQKKYKWEMRHD